MKERKPIMWLIEREGTTPYTTMFHETAAHAALCGYTVSPIYSALSP